MRDPRVFEAMRSFLERLEHTAPLVVGVRDMIALASARDGGYDHQIYAWGVSR